MTQSTATILEGSRGHQGHAKHSQLAQAYQANWQLFHCAMQGAQNHNATKTMLSFDPAKA